MRPPNNGWNKYDEAQEDGSLKSVSSPQLSEAEFEAKLSLNAVNVTGDQMIDFFYDDERMFWGHSIVVNSLNGIDFNARPARSCSGRVLKRGITRRMHARRLQRASK